MRISDWSSDVCSSDLQDIRVLLLEGVSQTAVDTFRDAGYTSIDLHAKSLPEDELRRRIADAHFIGIRSRTQLTAEVLADARRLLAVGCFCIGTNQVDTEAAQLAGIPVFNAPYSNTRSVAERSEEHTSELQSLMRISYAVFCLKKKKQ